MGGQLGDPGAAGNAAADAFEAPHVTFQARIEAKQGGSEGELIVTAKVLEGWHIYSVSQQPGGPQPTKLTLKSDPKIQLKGAFRADPAPKVHKGEFDVPSEEHEGSVTWTVPVTLPANIDPGNFSVELEAKGQACADTCLQFREKVPVKLVGFKAKASSNADTATPDKATPNTATPDTATPDTATPDTAKSNTAAGGSTGKDSSANAGTSPANSAMPAGKPGPFKPRFTHASVHVLTPASPVQPGSTIELSVVATPDARYHIYAYDEFDRGDAGQSKPALIGISLPDGWKRSAVAADSKPVLHGQDLYHEKKVTWKLPITVPKEVVSGEYPVHGYLGLQTCDDKACDAPAGVEFRLTLAVGTGASDHAGKAQFVDALGYGLLVDVPGDVFGEGDHGANRTSANGRVAGG